MAGETDPLEAGQDPDEDTPVENPEDKAGDADQSDDTDWKARAEKAEKALTKSGETISRQGAQIGQFKAALKGVDPAEAGDGESSGVDRLQEESWELARTVHGEEALSAYDVWAPLYEAAETPADHIAALEAYHQARLGETKETKGAEGGESSGDGQQTRQQALQPRVDPNRGDASPDSDQQSEAGKSFEQVVAGRWDRLMGRG